MGAFTTKKTLYGNASQIPVVAEQIRQAFAADGYEVRIDNPAKGQEIYITKGGFIKAALGLRSALKITMKPSRNGNIDFEAGVSIFKQQFVPTVITMGRDVRLPFWRSHCPGRRPRFHRRRFSGGYTDIGRPRAQSRTGRKWKPDHAAERASKITSLYKDRVSAELLYYTTREKQCQRNQTQRPALRSGFCRRRHSAAASAILIASPGMNGSTQAVRQLQSAEPVVSMNHAAPMI